MVGGRRVGGRQRNKTCHQNCGQGRKEHEERPSPCRGPWLGLPPPRVKRFIRRVGKSVVSGCGGLGGGRFQRRNTHHLLQSEELPSEGYIRRLSVTLSDLRYSSVTPEAFSSSAELSCPAQGAIKKGVVVREVGRP